MNLFGSPTKSKKSPPLRKSMPWLDKETQKSDQLFAEAKELPLLKAAIIGRRTSVVTTTEDMGQMFP